MGKQNLERLTELLKGRQTAAAQIEFRTELTDMQTLKSRNPRICSQQFHLKQTNPSTQPTRLVDLGTKKKKKGKKKGKKKELLLMNRDWAVLLPTNLRWITRSEYENGSQETEGKDLFFPTKLLK